MFLLSVKILKNQLLSEFEKMTNRGNITCGEKSSSAFSSQKQFNLFEKPDRIFVPLWLEAFAQQMAARNLISFTSCWQNGRFHRSGISRLPQSHRTELLLQIPHPRTLFVWSWSVQQFSECYYLLIK